MSVVGARHNAHGAVETACHDSTARRSAESPTVEHHEKPMIFLWLLKFRERSIFKILVLNDYLFLSKIQGIGTYLQVLNS